MSIIDKKSVLSGLTVQEAMRRVVAHLPVDASIEEVTRTIIKFRVNAILITNEKGEAVGVVSKTNVMGAYYAGLPIESPLEVIMMPSPLFCRREDSLESALDVMRKHRVHRIYVMGDTPHEAVGVLAYYDILGLLYRYCHKCERNILRNKGIRPADNNAEAGADINNETFVIRDVMTSSVRAYGVNETLLQVMEGIEADQVGAVLIRDEKGLPAGVVSKTDLLLAYRHGISPEVQARSIMQSPVRSCNHTEPLVLAIQKMIFSDVQRVFVHKDDPRDIVGVLSLSDAARARSGSCRACTSSRIQVEESAY